eukprot:COSAG02_NODE_25608_length_653_cov_1.375451_1_plen_49_part_10
MARGVRQLYYMIMHAVMLYNAVRKSPCYPATSRCATTSSLVNGWMFHLP